MIAPSPLRVVAWTPTLRWVVNALTWLAYANLLLVAWVLWLDFSDGAGRAPPLLVLITVVGGTAVPRLLAASFRLFCHGQLAATEDTLKLSVGRLGFDLPRARVAAAEAWRLPAPGAGFSLRLASGRRFERQLQPLDPASVLPLPISPERLTPFAEARAALHRTDARALLFKYAVFPLVPVVLIFRVHQLLTYGGPFGQYHQDGLAAYLRTFVVDGGSTLAHLVVFAGVVRSLVEAIALLDGVLAPARARKTRRAAEWACRIAYYGGIPAALAFAFLR